MTVRNSRKRERLTFRKSESMFRFGRWLSVRRSWRNPLICVEWFVCLSVSRCERCSVMVVQVCCKQSRGSVTQHEHNYHRSSLRQLIGVISRCYTGLSFYILVLKPNVGVFKKLFLDWSILLWQSPGENYFQNSVSPSVIVVDRSFDLHACLLRIRLSGQIGKI